MLRRRSTILWAAYIVLATILATYAAVHAYDYFSIIWREYPKG